MNKWNADKQYVHYYSPTYRVFIYSLIQPNHTENTVITSHCIQDQNEINKMNNNYILHFVADKNV